MTTEPIETLAAENQRLQAVIDELEGHNAVLGYKVTVLTHELQAVRNELEDAQRAAA